MILKQLTLRNFCLFRGQQTLDLDPTTRNKASLPIVLFGGRNGTGKTTVLDAIQLALYGARARCSKRGDLAYDEFLRQSIHLGASSSEGAGVSLSFRTALDGEDRIFEVCRSWRVQGAKVREDLKVFQDGLPDHIHTENWTQLVEEFFPLEISQLFFFDAEKIRSLAEDETSSQVLGTAVKSLLGLDIVERLIADSAVLQARLAKEIKTEPTSTEYEGEALERQVEQMRAEIDALQLERSEIENNLQRARAEQARAEETFAAVGGKHWQKKDQYTRKLAELKKTLEECEHRLVALSASELPLCLVDDLLAAVQQQDEREREAGESSIIQRILLERDEQLTQRLAKAKVSAKFLQIVDEHLAADRKARFASKEVAPRLSLSENARAHLHHLSERTLGDLREEAMALLSRHLEIQRETKKIEKAQTLAPDDESIGQLVERMKTATERFTTLKDDARRLDATIAGRKVEWEASRKKLQAIQKHETKEEFARDDKRRMAQMAARTRVVMQEFLARATERKIDRLSELITTSFRFLLRKQTMVERIHIDPTSFAITLFDNTGRALPKQRLSEGEKQIFAIAVLWGLARASARPLPAIIDTPMARLDAAHRTHLIERYFPHASHQVIILSTDTEVDHHYYQALKPHIARAYHLSYSEETKATTAEEGYFWKESPEGTAAKIDA